MKTVVALPLAGLLALALLTGCSHRTAVKVAVIAPSPPAPVIVQTVVPPAPTAVVSKPVAGALLLGVGKPSSLPTQPVTQPQPVPAAPTAAPDCELQSITTSAGTVTGGTSFNIRIDLTSPAPVGGASITLSTQNDSNHSNDHDETLVVPEGDDYIIDPIDQPDGTGSSISTYTATYNGLSASVAVTIQGTIPPADNSQNTQSAPTSNCGDLRSDGFGGVVGGADQPCYADNGMLTTWQQWRNRNANTYY